MQSAKFHVRRAVIDDLPELIALWRSMNFAPEELENRLTDFQVAVDGEGKLVGAVAFEAAGQQGRIHHEAFHDFGVAEQVRPLLWDKIRMLAQNNIIFRVWTQESAPFWKQAGLEMADKDGLQKLPAKWGNAQGGWLTFPLKEEAAIKALTGNSDVDLLMKTEREKTERTLGQARMVKSAATVLAIIFALLVGILILYALKRDPWLLQGVSR